MGMQVAGLHCGVDQKCLRLGPIRSVEMFGTLLVTKDALLCIFFCLRVFWPGRFLRLPLDHLHLQRVRATEQLLRSHQPHILRCMVLVTESWACWHCILYSDC